MKKHQFYGKIQKVREEKYGVPLAGIMELYVEGQEEPIHKMSFNNFQHGLPAQVVDFTFQDYINNSGGMFNEIVNPSTRSALRIYRNEKRKNTLPREKTYVFLPGPTTNPKIGLEFVLAEREYGDAWKNYTKKQPDDYLTQKCKLFKGCGGGVSF